MKVLEQRKTKTDVEIRIILDDNGFTLEQIRFLPVESWEANDGWRTTRYISSNN